MLLRERDDYPENELVVGAEHDALESTERKKKLATEILLVEIGSDSGSRKLVPVPSRGSLRECVPVPAKSTPLVACFRALDRHSQGGISLLDVLISAARVVPVVLTGAGPQRQTRIRS